MSRYGSFKYGEKKYGSRWITDRTEIDLINNTFKAFLNYTDMNRIEENMQELLDLGVQCGYWTSITFIKTDWKNYSISTSNLNIPTRTHMQRIINNLKSLRANFLIYPTTPEAPATMEKITIYIMNDFEQILKDLFMIVQDIKEHYRECGAYECGED